MFLDGIVYVFIGNYIIFEGGELSINCFVIDEVFIGWFMFSGKKIINDLLVRVYVRLSGSLKYLEIFKVNKVDWGIYECRGIRNKM